MTRAEFLNGGVNICPVCGRPDIGPLRCPHAIDRRYPCPEAKPVRVKGNNPYMNFSHSQRNR